MNRRLFAACVIPLAWCASFAAFGAQRSEGPGANVFRARCIGCHSIACNRSGPKLEGVVGRQAGSVSDFAGYSDALKNSKLTWTEETLNRWVENPEKLVPGTAMTGGYVKVENAKERSLVIQFVRRGDTSLDLCGPKQ
jgi:cytochrome c